MTRGGFADVRVVDAAGRAVPNASVTVLPAGEFPYDADFDQTRIDATVGPEGRARLRMCVGPRRLKAQGKDGAISETADLSIREVIRRHFGVSYHPDHVRKLLRHKLRFSPQKPRRQARERDEEAIRRWCVE